MKSKHRATWKFFLADTKPLFASIGSATGVRHLGAHGTVSIVRIMITIVTQQGLEMRETRYVLEQELATVAYFTVA